MNKKLIITIGIVLGIVALGIAAYFAWHNRQQIAQYIPGVGGGGQIPPAQQMAKKITILSSQDVLEYWVADFATSSDIFYIAKRGDLIHVDAAGKEDKIATIKNGKDLWIKPSRDGKLFLMQQVGSSDQEMDVLDAKTGKTQAAFIGVVSADWGPQPGILAVLQMQSENERIATNLMIADMLGKNTQPQKIMSFHQQDYDIQWIRDNQIILMPKPASDIISQAWTVDLKAKTMKQFVVGRGLMLSWAKFGDIGLKFSSLDGTTNKLMLIDSAGNKKTEFSFKTFPDKCAIVSPKQMYCAISRDQDAFSAGVFPDDYLKRAVYFHDGLYNIDFDKNSLQAVFEDNDPLIDATHLMLMGTKLLFINRYDNKLYSLQLP